MTVEREAAVSSAGRTTVSIKLDIPDALKVPEGSVLLLQAWGEGVQSYECDQNNAQWTFKKSQARRDLAAELPADRIMVETDAPYLAPGKFRGKRNEPSYVVEVAKVLAETRGVSLEEISRQTTENFFRLFSKVPAPKAAA